jgi:hypothetical protein
MVRGNMTRASIVTISVAALLVAASIALFLRARSAASWQAAESLRSHGIRVVTEWGRPYSLLYFDPDEPGEIRPFSRDVATLISKVTSLRRIDLRRSGISDADLEILSTLPYLEYLDLSENEKVTSEGCKWLPKFKSLSKLSLAHDQIGDDGLRAISGCRQLVGLDLRETGITDEGMTAVTELQHLNWLSIRGNKKVTDAGLKQLKIRGLTTLECDETGVRGHTLDDAPWSDSLEVLSAGSTTFDDDGAKNLSGFTQLKWLDLMKTRITDLGVKELTKIKTLVLLNLWGDRGVSDASIPDFITLPKTTSLAIPDTGITKQGSATLYKHFLSSGVSEPPPLFNSNTFKYPDRENTTND